MTKSSKRKQFKNAFRVFSSRGILVYVCLALILIMIFAAVFAPLLTPYTPYEQNLLEARQGPSPAHLLGTDHLGRDLLTRLIYGTRISLTIGLSAGIIGALLGITFGLIAGYFPGVVSSVIMRATDALLSIPPLILCMTMAIAIGGSIWDVSIVIGITMMPSYTRLFYGLVLGLRENDYITAASLIGQNDMVIMYRHLLPNCFASAIVMFTINLGNAIMLESALSYLGVGITVPTPAWGAMVAEGYRYIMSLPRLALLPGICVLLVVVSFNIVGDGLRDALDPKLRGKL